MIRPKAETEQAPLSPEDAVLSVLAATPDHKIHGKKRLQKIAFFCSYCDVPISARFQIRHFGVFSTEIAEALDFLSVFGDVLTQDEQVGPNRYFMTVFSLHGHPRLKPSETISKITKLLAEYPTPSLEVASTIAYFQKHGWSEADSVKETKRIKPAISTPTQIATSKSLLKRVADLCVATHGQRSANS